MPSRHSPLQDLEIASIEQAAAAQLRQRREDLKLSQRQLARMLDTFDIPSSRSLINKYELGPGKGGSKMSLMAARAFGLILYGSESGLLDSLDSGDSGSNTPAEPFVNPDMSG